MNLIKSELEQYQLNSNLSIQQLYSIVQKLQLEGFNYREILPKNPKSKTYLRKQLQIEHLECILIYWPPQVQSAIHQHTNFFGVVKILEGTLDNNHYYFENHQLTNLGFERFLESALIKEPSNTIHRLSNSNNKGAYSLHFYFPKKRTLEQVKIFNPESQSIATLNQNASSASWNEPNSSFLNLEENAFEYINFENYKKSSHAVSLVYPKPKPEIINQMIVEYYNEQAKNYDNFDTENITRDNYTKKVNHLIAKHLQKTQTIENVLDVACGTGRRALQIRSLSEKNYQISGVDISSEMCCEAEQKGIQCLTESWLNCEIQENFDAITWLYAFGHIPSNERRIDSLKKVYMYLKKGGFFYFDLFNLNNENEWGPQAEKYFHENNLEKHAYDLGDVFYRLTIGKRVAFLHYFTEKEITALLVSIGFKIIKIHYIGYVKNPGELVQNKNSGNIFIIAQKN